MMKILPASETSVLGVRISGTLTHEDSSKLQPEMRLRADQLDHFDVLVELDDLEGMEPAAIRDDLRFTKDFADDIRRMAIVTDESRWSTLSEYLGTPLGDLLGIEVKHFEDRSVAWDWLHAN